MVADYFSIFYSLYEQKSVSYDSDTHQDLECLLPSSVIENSFVAIRQGCYWQGVAAAIAALFPVAAVITRLIKQQALQAEQHLQVGARAQGSCATAFMGLPARRPVGQIWVQTQSQGLLLLESESLRRQMLHILHRMAVRFWTDRS